MGSKSKTKSNSALIKGYLPVQVTIPNANNDSSTESCMFVKEHKQTTSSLAALFVVNAPMVPNVRTHLFLHFLFSKFGEVEKVTVVRNPRDKNTISNTIGEMNDMNSSGLTEPSLWSENSEYFSQSSNLFEFQKNIDDEGRFAHVLFVSSKEMKRSLLSIKKLKCQISVSPDDLSQLVSESKYLRKQEQESNKIESDDEDDDSKSEEEEESIPILTRLVNRRKQNIIPRSVLLNKCNEAMEQFELAEENSKKSRGAITSEPDEDGFVTVSYSNVVGSKHELEEDDAAFGGTSMGSKVVLERRKGNKRSRKKKEGNTGSSELKDFYRFQMRETRKKNIEELRSKFEQDLKAVQKMKDQKLYRPF